MAEKHRKFLTGADIAVMVIVLTVFLFSVLSGGLGYKTEHIVYSIVTDNSPAGSVAPGDSVINLKGGKLGTVTAVSEDRITVEAEVKVFSKTYYAGGTAIRNDEKYDFAVNAYHMKGTVRDLTANGSEK